MRLFCSGLVLLLLLIQGIQSQNHEILGKCCQLGSSWADEKLKCEKFIGPVAGIKKNDQSSCLQSVKSCCEKAYRQQDCDLGKSDAKAALACTGFETGQRRASIDIRRDCCEACKLGIKSASSSKSCENKVSFGESWDLAFVECCEEKLSGTTRAASTKKTMGTTGSTVTTETTEDIDAELHELFPEITDPTFTTQADLCELMKGLLCTDICVPTPGSYYCKCREGSTLQADGRSCESPTTTTTTKKVTTKKATMPTSKPTTKATKPTTKATTKLTTTTKAPTKATTQKSKPKTTKKPTTKTPPKITKKEIEPSSPLTTLTLITAAKMRTTRALTADDNELNVCPSGYRLNPATNTCDDIDECQEKQPCPEDNQCRNSNGSYECLPYCEFGYRWNLTIGRCVDVDECLENTHKCIPETENCRNLEGSFECEIKCEPGLIFNGFYAACLDVNECSELAKPCPQPDTICVNTLGSYECKSFNDYPYYNESAHILAPSARNKTTDYDAITDEGITDNICAHGFAYNTDLKNCEDIDECELMTQACAQDEVCRNTAGGYDCVPAGCHRGFVLVNDTCLDVDECEESLDSCLDNEICRNTNGSFTCEPARAKARPSTTERAAIICRKGYKANYEIDACVDIDECVEGPGCRDHERCINFQGTYDCSPLCGQGWYFDLESKTCQDVDECMLGHHRCRQRTQYCRNTNGSYTCEALEACLSGYRRTQNGSCIDVDECQEALHSCSRESHRYCVNLEGGYECITRLPSCSPGFQYSLLTHDCEDIDECRSGKAACDSRFNDRCINLPGTYRCERPVPQIRRVRPACPTGLRYDLKLRMCASKPPIDANIDECSNGRHNCGREKCYNLPGSFECAKAVLPTIKRRTTKTVEMGTRSHGDDNCSAGSKYDHDRGGCVDIDECNEIEEVCGSYEDCINTPGNFECRCKLGFRRENFTQACVDVNECLQENDCLSSQRCDNTIGSYTCVRFLSCGTGYTLNSATEVCEDDDECLMGTHNCPKGWNCKNTLGNFRCIKDKKNPVDKLRTTTWPSRWTTRGSHSYGFPSRSTTTYRPRVTSTSTTTTTTTTRRATTTTTEAATTTTPRAMTTTPATTPRPTTTTPRFTTTQRPITTTARVTTTQRPTTTYRSWNITIKPWSTSTYRAYNTSVRAPWESTYRPLNTTVRPAWSSTYRPWNTTLRPPWQSTYRPWNTTYKPNPTPRYHLNTTVYIPPTRARPLTTTEFIPTVGPVVTSSNWIEWTTTRSPMTCPPGYETGSIGQCIDINECQRNPRICGQFQCINFMGSYKCEHQMLCPIGHRPDPVTGECKDLDECAQNTHECGPYQKCQNRPGGYFCFCPQGYEIRGKECIDVDECSRFSSGICGIHGRCENTQGSYRCTCEEGFMNDPKSKACIDFDECTAKSNLCEHQCYNTWGGHRCGCHNGYRLKADNRTCEDIDECKEFKDNNLCIGICENTAGSYSCKCPDGYRLADDARTCQDIDECATNTLCQGANEICQNVRGSYRCNKINCPAGYIHDPQRKNRCMRESPFCPAHDTACFNRPAHYTYNYIAIVSMFPIPASGEVELFVMRGAYNVPGSTVRFSMAFVTARAPPNVRPATEECFSLKRPYPSQAVLAMTKTLQGPQDIELDLSMEIYSPNGNFAGSAVAKIFIVITQYEF